MNYLSVEKLTKGVGERILFQDISFGLDQGQKTALIARNGTGKTTTSASFATGLAMRGFNPPGVVFPVSSAILDRIDDMGAAFQLFVDFRGMDTVRTQIPLGSRCGDNLEAKLGRPDRRHVPHTGHLVVRRLSGERHRTVAGA